MQVKDLMVPLQEYGKVDLEASLYDALVALDKAQANLPAGKAPHRAVLVVDESGEIVGNVGRLGFVKAFAEGVRTPETRLEMDRAGLSPASISTVMSHLHFFQERLGSLRERAKSIKARDIMHPVGESISESAHLQEAIDMFGACQTLSVSVRRGHEVVGVLRLDDLFQEIASRVLSPVGDSCED